MLFLTVFLILGACSPATPTTRPAGEVEDYPLDTRTGIPAVDNVLAAVESGMPEELYELIDFTIAPCTTADGLGGPPKCRDGEPEGTQLEVLPFIESHGGFHRRNEMDNRLVIDVSALYAVYRVSETALNEAYYPPGEYIVFFVPRQDEPAPALRIGDGGIVRIDYHFDMSPESLQALLVRDTSEVILAPKSR